MDTYNVNYAEYLGSTYGKDVQERYVCISCGLPVPEPLHKKTCTYRVQLNCAGKLSYPAEVRFSQILDMIRDEPMSAPEISVELDISVQSTYRLLKAMEKQGKIKQVSEVPRRYKPA